MKALLLFFLTLCLVFPAQAHDHPANYSTEARALLANKPKDVASFLERRIHCNHWGDEFPAPDDEDRRAQIKKATEELQCDRLDAEEKAIREKYKDNSEILKALDKAVDLFG